MLVSIPWQTQHIFQTHALLFLSSLHGNGHASAPLAYDLGTPQPVTSIPVSRSTSRGAQGTPYGNHTLAEAQRDIGRVFLHQSSPARWLSGAENAAPHFLALCPRVLVYAGEIHAALSVLPIRGPTLSRSSSSLRVRGCECRQGSRD